MEGFVKELEIRELSALGEIERVSAECVTLRDMNSTIVQTVRQPDSPQCERLPQQHPTALRRFASLR
jgi:hypothetical protein